MYKLYYSPIPTYLAISSLGIATVADEWSWEAFIQKMFIESLKATRKNLHVKIQIKKYASA